MAKVEPIKLNLGNTNKSDASMPAVFVYTTYENNYHIGSGLKSPDKTNKSFDKMRSFKRSIEKYQSNLKKTDSLDDTVKFYFVPKGFKNHCDGLTKLFEKPFDASKENRP